ncbi:unnamed protein product, partial [Iphiclides podalirius]
MVLQKSLLVLLAVTAVTLITAQGQSNGPNYNSQPPRRGPNNDHRFPSFGFGFPPFFGSGFQFPPFDFNNGRDSYEHSGSGGHNNGFNNQEISKEIVRCNYTTQPGRSCISCNQTLLCSRLNLGIMTTCRGQRPHCNNGICSSTPIQACNSTSSG